ncbi:MAG: acyltransferase [Erysipelotrichaceae bacterium]|nr:acyltransferase [Erysipelotrichaceae bacterium]
MNQKNYHAIDLIKYICAILVIMVHTAPLLPNYETANWYLMTILGRFVVPFFFISTGYFTCQNAQRYGDKYFRRYIIALIKSYLIWSIIYLPCGIHYIATEFDIPYYLYPIALIFALIYVGTYFHLWYIPALILALLLVQWFMKHFRKRYLLTLSFLCFLIGAMETYYGYIHIPFIRNLIDHYIRLFFTTRNGLFFGFFYVAWGYFIAQKDTWLKHVRHHRMLMILFFGLMILEATFIHNSDNLDSNILLMAAPFTICLFLYAKDLDIQWNLPYHKLREYSSLYYFTHAYFLILIPYILQIFHYEMWFEAHGLIRFILVLFMTHCVSFLLIYIRKRNKERKAKIASDHLL